MALNLFHYRDSSLKPDFRNHSLTQKNSFQSFFLGDDSKLYFIRNIIYEPEQV